MGFHGGCLCGAVRFEVDVPALPPVIYCHCKQCRQSSGHHVAAVSGVQHRTDTQGEVRWFDSSPGYQRGFCPACGSQLFWRDLARDHLSIMAGAFDDSEALTAKMHIFTASKPGYYPICDDLPQHPGNAI